MDESVGKNVVKVRGLVSLDEIFGQKETPERN
jgi:hypothetical protein